MTESPPPPKGPRNPTWIRAAALVLVAVLAYASVVFAGFVFDDEYALLSNPVVQGRVPAGEAFLRDFWGNPPERTIGSYRPFVLLALVLDGRLGGMSPGPFHTVNVLWHALAVVAAYLAWRRIGGGRAALAGAGLLAVLAAPSEAVQGIVGRADLMMATFVLAGLHAHRTPGWKGAAIATTTLVLALGSKESAVAAPLAWAAMDLLVPAGDGRRFRPGRLALYGLAGVAYLAGRAVALGAVTARAIDPISNPLVEADLAGRLLGACRVLAERYLLGLADPTRRLYDCSASACGPSGPTDPVAWLGVLAVLALAASPFLLRRRAPSCAAGLAWFGLFLLPSSNLLFLGPTIYGERLLYVPAIGLAPVVAHGLYALADRLRRPLFAPLALVLLGLGNAAAVQVRNLDWRTPEALYLSGLEYAPDSAKVRYNVAWAAFRRGEYAVAEANAREALELRPDHPQARGLLAGALDVQGRTREAGEQFAIALEEGRDPDLVVHHATFLARHGQYRKALDEVRDRLQAFPDHVRLRDLEQRLVDRLAQ